MSNLAPLRLCLLLVAVAAAGARADAPPLRDPMQPFKAAAGTGGTSVTGGPRFRLTAVLISPTRRVAILNGAPRQEGDRVDGATLTRIDAQSVRLEQGGASWTIHLGQSGEGPRTEGAPSQ
ncbi:MAG TPA: hypothetical protein VFX89_17000 [Gammaproteobacteria bacterium]|nr:hypothetical protein [Gammaproteobacteria bacterium]